MRSRPGDRHPSALDPEAAARRRRTRWVVLTAVLGIVGLLTALFAFGLGQDPATIRSPLIDRAAPAFRLSPISGGPPVALAAMRGDVVVVNFWASWCADCRIEHPALRAAWQRYADRGVVFVGIPFEDPTSASLAYLRELGGGWPVLRDDGSRTAIAYGVYGVPETFVIDRSGVVRFKHIGPVAFGQLSDEITRLLPGGP